MSSRLILASNKNSSAPGASTAAYSYATLLAHGNTTGPLNNTTIVESAKSAVFSIAGTPNQGSFTPYGSCWSNYFSGNQYLNFASSANFGFGTGDFTIEYWANYTAFPGQQASCIDFRGSVAATATSLGIDATNHPIFYDGPHDTTYVSTIPISIGSWNHIALVRRSGVWTLFVNGTVGATATTSSDLNASNPCRLGGNINGTTNAFVGYMSNVRVVLGIALYTASFTPSTIPLTAVTNTQLLTCNSNRFVDTSVNALVPTLTGSPVVDRYNPFGNVGVPYTPATYGGSAYFNGSTYLIGPGNNTITNFAGTFTVEMWFYPLTFNAAQGLLYNWGSGSATTSSFSLSVSTSGSINLSYGIGASNVNTGNSSGAMVLNQWNHIAVTRDASNKVYFCINGVVQNIATLAGSFNTSGDNIAIGAAGTSGGPITSGATAMINGYLSDVSVLNGTCKYAAAYTPPTTPLAAVTDSNLLLKFQNAGVVDMAMNNNLIGHNPTFTTTAKFGSQSFDMKSGTYYSVVGSRPSDTIPASVPFTVECWFYYTSATAANTYQILSNQTTTNGSSYLGFSVSGPGASSVGATGMVLGQGIYGTSSSGVYGTNMPTANAWNHLAWTRDSTGTVRMFLNGVLQTLSSYSSGSTFTASTATLQNTATTPVYAGNSLGSGEYYVQEMRVLNGQCAYITNFTPPTVTFPNQ